MYYKFILINPLFLIFMKKITTIVLGVMLGFMTVSHIQPTYITHAQTNPELQFQIASLQLSIAILPV